MDIIWILGDHLDPWRSSGSLEIIWILGDHLDPWRSFGSLEIFWILGDHLDPWISSGSLQFWILGCDPALCPDLFRGLRRMTQGRIAANISEDPKIRRIYVHLPLGPAPSDPMPSA
ncbi:Hypothetical protein NTJ_06287 [Nesidiocoris tenuis]|uniref:Calcineurin-like phosphoesterase domain-containing protein n=1 Tax=Nesidiocoris tenuis TaxID=355587 RepID=A0ABN7AMM5_9HEMI|nr:Hypothetical protein NTJ_06287 [Nesidiocoris tenuis]